MTKSTGAVTAAPRTPVHGTATSRTPVHGTATSRTPVHGTATSRTSARGAATRRTSARGAATRRLLIAAAAATLAEHGFAGSSARVVADRAGVNQGLIFYHFGSVTGLLLAALDDVSATRRARYGQAVAAAGSPAELVEVASSIFREDLDAGDAAVLVAMIAGAAATPGLGAEVAERIGPWIGFARDAVAGVLVDSPLGSVVSADSAGFAVVALYLGMEMLTQLDGDGTPATALFDQAARLAALLGAMGTPSRTAVPGGATL
jgi:AcrR family transcriptional regulator